MAKKRARSQRATAKSPRRKTDSHLFAITVPNVRLNDEQVHRLASQIRNVTTKELLRMDFIIEELEIPPGGKFSDPPSCQGCG